MPLGYILRINIIILLIGSFHSSFAQYKITENDSINNHLVSEIEFNQFFGTVSSIDNLIKIIEPLKKDEYSEEIEIITNILEIRKYYLIGDFQSLFSHVENGKHLKSKNTYLNVFKNQAGILYLLMIDSIDLAIDEFFKYAYSEQIQDSLLIAHYNYQAGQFLYRQSNYLKSIDFFLKSLPYFKNIKNQVYSFNKFQEIYSNVALCYMRMGDYSKAEYYYQKCNEYINKSEEYILLYSDLFSEEKTIILKKFVQEALGVLYGNLGQLYILRGNYSTGISMLKESIKINEQEGFDNRDAFITAGHLINGYFNLNMYDSAIYFTNKYYEKLKSVDAHIVASEVAFNIMKYYIPIDVEKALYYLNEYDDAKQSQNQINKSKRFFENYSDLIDQKYILMLENEKLKQFQFMQKEKLNRFIFLSVISVLIILVVTYFIFYLNIKKRNHVIELFNSDLKHINQQLETANMQKLFVMGMVAHDLKGPILSIESLNDLKKSNAISSVEYDQIMSGLLKTLYAVINDIIDYVKTENLDTKHLELNNISYIIQEAINEVNKSYIKKGVIIHYNPITTYLKTDLNLFKRLIQNLLTNAIKFSYHDGHVFIRLKESVSSVELEIEDHGIGIPQDMIPILFEPFTKASRKGTDNEPSHGLGMSIIKRIVDYHGGLIEIKSSIGQGTCVSIRFPK